MTQLGLNINWCKDIKSSDSTLLEKLEIDKEKMESEEQKAIFRMICVIKQNNLKQAMSTEGKDAMLDKVPQLAKQGSVIEAYQRICTLSSNLSPK